MSEITYILAEGAEPFPSIREAAENVAEDPRIPLMRGFALSAIQRWRGFRRTTEKHAPKWVSDGLDVLQSIVTNYLPGADVAKDMLEKDSGRVLGIMHRVQGRMGFLERNGLECAEPGIEEMGHLTPADLVEMKLALQYNLSVAHAARYFGVAPATKEELKAMPTKERILLKVLEKPGTFIGRCCSDKPTAVYGEDEMNCIECDATLEVHDYLAENAGWAETASVFYLDSNWREIAYYSMGREYAEYRAKVEERARVIDGTFEEAAQMLLGEGVAEVEAPPSDPNQLPDRYVEVREALRERDGQATAIIPFPGGQTQKKVTPFRRPA